MDWLEVSPEERAANVAQLEVEMESEYICRVGVDLDVICGAEATRICHEPYTPLSVEIMCCQEHAEDFIYQGYLADPEADKRLAQAKQKELEYYERDELDRTLTEGQRLGMERL